MCRSCREDAMFSFEAVKWCKSKKSTGKNTNEEEMVNLLEDEEEEEVVDSGDRDIHIGVSSTVLEHLVCGRESLIFDDNN